ncbi:ketopantoate reductase family protein [Lutibacter maritimus]|uniref:2-dehydropantoate 2-reductase n=1 Tax=Lutibacter maritimus TaxID=593133 RepID=A0A1I6RIF6_9FLAO|nr:2-dehydropantoate 2-reductase [Lutibacter maritimus]SFS64258.1 ketopantoate reductase [Lutibacter maritimus]
MNIVIYGTGGVGGYFGARLAQAGNNVTFIARGKHLATIQKNGLKLISPKGDCLIYPANVTDSIAQINNIDLVLVCVKTWQLKDVAKKINKNINEKTVVISLLNGVENQDILISEINKKHIIGGLCKVISKVKDFGVIHHISYEPTIIFGELNHEKSQRAIKIEQVLKNAGINTILSDDIQKEIWTKFLYITTVSAIGALTRTYVDEMVALPEIKKIMYKTAEEILAIANAKDININKETIETQFKIIENQPPKTTSSLQRDIMDGKPSELESQNGTIVRLGKELGIPTPTNDFIYFCLLPQEKKARQLC